MLGLILFVLVIGILYYSGKGNDDMAPFSFCFFAIIALLSYWFLGATPRDYTSKKYQELDKKYHSELLILENTRGKALFKDVNKMIYKDYVERWHLLLGFVSFNEKKTPCGRIEKDENNYPIITQDEILKVYHNNNFLRYLTFLCLGIVAWTEIEYTCAYDVETV